MTSRRVLLARMDGEEASAPWTTQQHKVITPGGTEAVRVPAKAESPRVAERQAGSAG
jgi:hypothetical protein